jgi:hypothetical protein
MNGTFITYCDYPSGHKNRIVYETYTKPRFLKYCEKHGFNFFEINENVAHPYNLGFAKVFWIKKNWHTFQPNSRIIYMDIDCCIVNDYVPAVFDSDFAITMESTGVLCMGGTWSLKVTEWSKKFIDEMCSERRQYDNKGIAQWEKWAENDAIYHVLGLCWGAGFEQLGLRPTTPFMPLELQQHIQFLGSEWGNTYDFDDVPSGYVNKEQSDFSYLEISKYIKPERCKKIDNIYVRHLSAGTIHLPWAKRYFYYSHI